MDNVTHALAGMLVADAVCVMRRERRHSVRAAAYFVSALANNLPDADIIYTWITTPKPLGSLLHHRGHTHTLLLALPAAWLLGWAVWRWFAGRNTDATPSDRRLFTGLALGGVLLHLSMDFGNNYGVHPFWPFSAQWFYGDSIFIVEPLWWAVAIPTVARAVERRWLKIALWVLLAAVLIACWFIPFVGMTTRLSLLAVTALSALVTRRGSERTRAGWGLAGCLAVALVFVLASNRAQASLRAATQASFPALSILDLATTPSPGNPACWEGLVAGEQAGVYRVLRATVALGPVTANECSMGADVEPTAPVTALTRANRGGVRWLTAYRADVATLRQLRRDDCRFRAMLRFARMPYVAPARRIAGDLRFDRQPGLDFADVRLVEGSGNECPRLIPGWSEPRAGLFGQ